MTNRLANQEVQAAIAAARVFKWEVARALGVADTTFSKWLRRELPPERRSLVMEAIGKLTRGDAV